MKVKRNTLLFLACLVWSAAGFNILRIGVICISALLVCVEFPYCLFWCLLCFKIHFGKLVKNTPPEFIPMRKKGIFLKFLMEKLLQLWR